MLAPFFLSRITSCTARKNKSYRTGVKHDSDAGAEALGWQVVVELRSDDTAVAVRAGDLAPDDSDLAALSFFRGSVDECDALS